MAPSLSIRLLGGFSASADEGPLRFPTRKSEALLAYLAYYPGTSQSREKLATLLWSSSGEEQGRQSLRQTLFTIKKVLDDGELIEAGRGKIVLKADEVDVDVVRLRNAIARGDRASLEEASRLYVGPLLDGFSTGDDEFDLWIERERELVREQILGARTRLLDELAVEDPERAIQLGLTILAEDPLRESVHRTLIRLYAGSGRRTAAVRQYNMCADILWRKLSVRPGAETRQLFESIRDEADDPPQTPVARVPQRRGDSRHILLVEDNALNQEVVRASLKGTRYDLTIVDDGAAALMELGRRQFDLALIDLELPFVDGLTLLDAIKDKGVELPVIVLTSYQESEHEVSALSRGAEDYLRKPIQRDVLLMRIEKVLRARDQSARGS